MMQCKKMFFAGVIQVVLIQVTWAQLPANYKGKPFQDSVYRSGAQVIPGRVELAYYDLGGEGIAYHDTTPQNEGASLNHTSKHWRPGISKRIHFSGKAKGLIFHLQKIGPISIILIKWIPPSINYILVGKRMGSGPTIQLM